MKILIIEDHDEFREMVKKYLKSQSMCRTILESESAEIGISLALQMRPDVILMDLRLPGMSGIEAAGKLKALLPECKIIILTMFETEAFKALFKSDAITDYIGKSEIYEKLIPSLQKLAGKIKHKEPA